MGINFGGKTDIGLKRSTNQDYFKILELENNICVMIVCDGMGGANGGCEASSLAAEAFAEYLKGRIAAADKNEYLSLLESALDAANNAVCEKAKQNRELEGMGTTLVCAVYDGESYYCLWVGDSRIYAINGKGICQISHDHSFVQTLVDSGSITSEEAKVHPNRNIITKAVGIEMEISADVCKLSDENLDGLLLCSDGLCGYVEEQEIEKIIKEKTDVAECCEELVTEANRAGGHDNITVVIHKKQ